MLMSSKSLCTMLRAAVIAVAVCGLFGCAYILPTEGANLAVYFPELAGWYLPWLLFLLTASLPCFAILVLIWIISSAVKDDRVFSIKSARIVKLGSLLMFGDVAFFFLGNVVFLLFNISHPGIFFVSLFVDVFGAALAVAAAVLSRYLTKAAALQEEADATI
jgi:hypothetical protein